MRLRNQPWSLRWTGILPQAWTVKRIAYAAEDAAELVDVDYSELPAVTELRPPLTASPWWSPARG